MEVLCVTLYKCRGCLLIDQRCYVPWLEGKRLVPSNTVFYAEEWLAGSSDLNKSAASAARASATCQALSKHLHTFAHWTSYSVLAMTT